MMHPAIPPAADPTKTPDAALRQALVLSLGAAVSLGITRFAYGMLLPPMREDLGWSYALAGAMNTSNAAGYLIGALLTPLLLRRASAGTGVASALVFITGGVLAARLGATQPARAGWLIGLYYGGTGLGISLSALVVPAAMWAASGVAHPWAVAWAVLSLACFGCVAGLRRIAGGLDALAPGPAINAGAAAPAPVHHPRVPWQRYGYALAGYGMFGVGYIGYMTFVVALLREQGLPAWGIIGFYAALGLAVMLSPRLWAGLLDRYRDGRPLALLNALLGAATLAPALSSAWPVVLASGLLFGAVFLSVVASTTAWVRHNLPAAQWAGGIGAFTIVFAAGQIIGPTVVGWIADGPGGLERGFIVSAVALWVGTALALRQKSHTEPA